MERCRDIFAGSPGGTELQNAIAAACPREGREVVITTCRYGHNEIPSSNETPAGCNVAPEPSGGEPQDQRGFRADFRVP